MPENGPIPDTAWAQALEQQADELAQRGLDRERRANELYARLSTHEGLIIAPCSMLLGGIQSSVNYLRASILERKARSDYDRANAYHFALFMTDQRIED